MGLAPIELSSVAAGTGGFVIHGQDAGDQAGAAVAWAGDLNGDGFDDLVIGARTADGAGNAAADAGASYVVFGAAGGFAAAIDLAAVAAGTGGLVIEGRDENDRAGFAVSSAGDLNGDGFDDLAIGARYGDGAGDAEIRSGETYVLFGRATGFGASVALADIAAGTGGFVLFGADPGDYSGGAVASAGDINGDGFDDLLIGAAAGDPDGPVRSNAGEAHVVFGSATGFAAPVDLAEVAAGTGGFVIRGEDADDRAGRSVAGIGDVNGDGLDDLLVGAWRADGVANGREVSGGSYVVFGRTGGFPGGIELADIAAGTGGFAIHGRDPFDYAGISVSSAGDINGDGFADILIGADGGDGRGYASNDAGETYVVFGKADGFGAGISLIDIGLGSGGFVVNGQDTNDRSGFAVAAAGDVNGDGYDDVVIGAYNTDPAGRANAGAAYVLFGKATGFTPSVDLAAIAAGTGGFMLNGITAGDRTGFAVAGGGDINGDGFADLLIGARDGDGPADGRDGAGETYVVLGRDFSGAVTHPGGAGSETLTGTTDADIMLGGGGNDTLAGGGGADVLIGGTGDDTIRLSDTAFRRIDGGSGTDTVTLDGTGLLLDLGTRGNSSLVGIERIDLGGTGNTLLLSALEVLNLSPDSNTVTIDGGAADTLSLGTGDWVAGAIVGGYRSYTDGQAVVRASIAIGNVLSRRVAVTAATAERPEGNGGTTAFTFTVTRSGDTSAADTVAYAVAGTGPRPANAADFAGGVLPSGTVSFAIGATSATITVDVVGDTQVEANEAFQVVLSAPSAGVALETKVATGVIGADDAITDLLVVNSTTNTVIPANPVFFEGPVPGLEKEYIRITPENLNMVVSGHNWFLHSGSGDDAITVAGGTNVLDGGTGSNFLTGASGEDTFFVDARGALADIWSTVNQFGAGDAATLWGVSGSSFNIEWIDGLGAAGFTGLTLRATADSAPTAMLTLVGYTSADLASGKLSVVFGRDDASSSDYLFVRAN